LLDCSQSIAEGFEATENRIHLPVAVYILLHYGLKQILLKEGKKDKTKMIKILPDAIKFILKHLDLGHRVLIHSRESIFIFRLIPSYQYSKVWMHQFVFLL
jgi:hypothetical protein